MSSSDLLEIFFTENDILLSDYLNYQDFDPSSKNILDSVLTRKGCHHLLKNHHSELISDQSEWENDFILLRTSIDRGEHHKSIKIFENLIKNLNNYPRSMQVWLLYFGAKAYQHAAFFDKALYLYRCLENYQPNMIQELYIRTDRCLLDYNLGQFQKCNSELQWLQNQLLLFKNEIPINKFLCSIGHLHIAFGNFTKAKEILSEVLKSDYIYDIYYRRSYFYLFQIYIYSGDFAKAKECLRSLISWFYDSDSELKYTFMRFWIALEVHFKSWSRVNFLKSQCQETWKYKNKLSFKVNIYAECKHEHSLRSLIILSRECRRHYDVYNRCFLWLETIRNQFFSINLKFNRTLKILKYLNDFFSNTEFHKERLQTELLLFKFQQILPSEKWTKDCYKLGHLYLLNELFPSVKSTTVIIFFENDNSLYLPNGQLIQFGKELFTSTILKYFATQNLTYQSIELISCKIYEVAHIDSHIVKKFFVSINRLHKRIGQKIFSIDKKNIKLRDDIKLIYL